MKESKTRKTPGERRREAIMEAALGLFIEKGYAAVTVDEIIRRSGGSKSSVYEYFGTKEGLLRAIITQVAEEVLTPISEGMNTRETLTNIGIKFCSEILTEKGMGMFSLAVSNAKRFPEISRMFFESGPKKSMDGVAEYMRKEAAAGRLNIKDPYLASDLFLCMILGKGHIAIPVGGAKPPSKAKIKELVEEAVHVFMSAYGKKGR